MAEGAVGIFRGSLSAQSDAYPGGRGARCRKHDFAVPAAREAGSWDGPPDQLGFVTADLAGQTGPALTQALGLWPVAGTLPTEYTSGDTAAHPRG